MDRANLENYFPKRNFPFNKQPQIAQRVPKSILEKLVSDQESEYAVTALAHIGKLTLPRSNLACMDINIS